MERTVTTHHRPVLTVVPQHVVCAEILPVKACKNHSLHHNVLIYHAAGPSPVLQNILVVVADTRQVPFILVLGMLQKEMVRLPVKFFGMERKTVWYINKLISHQALDRYSILSLVE
jgi:hypothetical protein